jgi:hypothetical protein
MHVFKPAYYLGCYSLRDNAAYPAGCVTKLDLYLLLVTTHRGVKIYLWLSVEVSSIQVTE